MINQVAKEIGQFLDWNHDTEIETHLCKCGAITMQTSTRAEISFLQKNAPYIKPTFEGVNANCNRCTNNWGVDMVDHSEAIEQLEIELEELEDQDEVTAEDAARISFLKEEIERLQEEEQE